MYRYSVDQAVTYTSEDFVLFRESPFACWMERLTLENPDHGILPDAGSTAPGHGVQRQDDLAETLRAAGKQVDLIDWDAEESSRRSATLAAMRRGAEKRGRGRRLRASRECVREGTNRRRARRRHLRRGRRRGGR